MKKIDEFILKHPKLSLGAATISLIIGGIIDWTIVKEDYDRLMQERDNK